MKVILLNVASLITAIAIFCSAVTYKASDIEKLDISLSSNELNQENQYNDDFFQDDDLGIGDLLVSNFESVLNSSDEISSDLISSIDSSSEYHSSAVSSNKPTSSKPNSSKPASSKPISSKVPPSSEEPSSSEILQSSEEEISSEDNSSNIESDYQEILEILAGTVQREIVGTNTTPKSQYYEAYKAQAVAAHSYMEYHKLRTGSYPSMSYATPNPKTIELVSEVLNELIYYNGQVINASYHAASGGHTQSAKYVWGYDVPYLQAVESAYDDYNSSYTISMQDAENLLISKGYDTSLDSSQWFDISSAEYTDGNFIYRMNVCNQTVTGRQLREQILGAANLKSPKITDITVSSDRITFTTMGYGHGAGLSQQGALGYAANEGYSYKQILSHYYTGVTIQ